MTSKALVFRMLKLLKPVRFTALIASIVIIGRVAVEVLAVYFLSPAVTTVAEKLRGESSTQELTRLLLFMVATQLCLALMMYLRTVWDTKLSMRAVFHMRAAVYDRLQRADMAFHESQSTGSLINRAINDLQAVRQFVNMSLLSSLDIVTSLAFYLGLLFMRSPWLLVAALCPVPFWLLLVSRFSQKAQPIVQKQQEAGDRVMSALSENLSGIAVIRAFGTDRQEIEKYERLNHGFLSELLRTVRLQAVLTPGLKLVGTLSHVGLFLVSAWLIKRREIEIGDLMLLGATMAVILSKLQLVNSVVEAYQKAIVSSRRLFEIMDLPDATEEKLTSVPFLQLRRGDVEFRRVSFAYGEQRALDRVSLVIPGGQVTALIGPTGAGKSTLTGLIARFYDPSEGELLIDGQNVKHVDRRDLRKRIGYVFQETFLFSSSIRDNILYGRKDVSEEMMRRAARVAHAEEFIERLHQGYDTLIGDRGTNLSGGQRQRLALARALVYDPDILILDDATAALDATTERLVNASLDSVVRGRTVILIANRLASVAKADNVVVMENGRITQVGTHDELIAEEGHYQDIIRLQLGSA